MSSSAPAPRLVGVDLARGVALVSMFVAHTAPTPGPGDVLLLSEFLTFPLFALLVGVGAELGARVRTPGQHLVNALVHAAALLALGWALDRAGAYVVIVLAQLGVLTLIAWALVRLPTWGVAGVGVVAAAIAPWTLEASAGTALRLAVEQSPAHWWFQLLVNHSYPQAVLVSMACAGIVLTRLLAPRSGVRTGLAWATGVVALGVAGALVLVRLTGRLELVPYETVPVVQVFVLLLAVATAALCLALGELPLRAVQAVVLQVARVGAMSLTVYSLHILWLAFWARSFRPGVPDDAWVNVVGLTLGALVVALLWSLVPWPRRWRRGPLEGAVSEVADRLAHRTAGPTRAHVPGGESGTVAR